MDPETRLRAFQKVIVTVERPTGPVRRRTVEAQEYAAQIQKLKGKVRSTPKGSGDERRFDLAAG